MQQQELSGFSFAVRSHGYRLCELCDPFQNGNDILGGDIAVAVDICQHQTVCSDRAVSLSAGFDAVSVQHIQHE